MNKIIKNNLETWKILAAGMNIQIDFVLQPVGSWCKINKTEEEKTIFSEEEKIPKLHNIYQYVDIEKYHIIKDLYRKILEKSSINYLDMNELFNSDKYSKNWLFINKFHVTDLGSKIISNEILKRLT